MEGPVWEAGSEPRPLREACALFPAAARLTAEARSTAFLCLAKPLLLLRLPPPSKPRAGGPGENGPHGEILRPR